MEEEAETKMETPPLGWIDRIGKEEARKDRLLRQDLIGGFVGAIVLSLLLWFFVAHKLEDTGFYTDEFGALEMFMMYFAGAFAVAMAVLKLIVRRRNILRPLDVASLLMLSVAHAVLLVSFPFDFEHVDAALPGFLQWTVGWMSDWVGAAILLLGLIGALIGAAFTSVVYVGVRREMANSLTEEGPHPED